MRIGETRKKRYVLEVGDTSAIMKVLNILNELESDSDIANGIESSARANICDAIDVLRSTLENDCEEIEIEDQEEDTVSLDSKYQNPLQSQTYYV